MPQGITTEEAAALRARITEALKDEPKRSPKRTAVRKAFGESNYGSFMGAARGASPRSRARVLAVLDGGTAPNRRPGVGRSWKYVSVDDSRALRAEVMKEVGAKHRSLGAFLASTMGLASKSQSGWYQVIKGSGAMTVMAAEKLRAALAGRPVAQPTPRATRHKPGPKPRKDALVLATPRSQAPRAPRNVLANLRLDAGHVLTARFGGNVGTLARELGITAGRFSKFLDGGTLTLEESGDVANRLSALGMRTESVSPAPGLTMIRAVAGGISVEAWRNGNGTTGAGEIEPPELRARKLVQRWQNDALEFVLQLAGGGAA